MTAERSGLRLITPAFRESAELPAGEGPKEGPVSAAAPALPAGNHSLSCRHYRDPDCQRFCLPFSQQFHLTPGFFLNRLVPAGIAGEAFLAAFTSCTPLGSSLFASVSTGAEVLLLLIPYAVLLLIIDAPRKYIVRHRTLKAAVQ